MRVRFSGLAFGGEAVGRADDGRVVFTAYAAPGDLAEVRVIEERPRWVRAELVRVIESGPARIAPPCPWFGACGGCQWQHVSYQEQLAAKQAVVERALGRPVDPIVPSPQPYEYRWRARLHVKAGAVGYRRWRSHEVVDVGRCLLVDPRLDAAIQGARGALPAQGELSAQLGANGQVALRCGRFRAGPDAVDLAAAGEPPFWVAAGEFAQPGADGNRALRELVRAGAQARGLRVLELYAGAGNFTRDLAADASALTAVEGAAAAVALLRRNLPTVPVEHAPVLRAVRVRARRGERWDVVVLDPPREGAREVCAQVGELGATRVVYVSCDPMTLARDLRTLEAAGYVLVRATPVDLMPQTFHVETVAVLTRAASG